MPHTFSTLIDPDEQSSPYTIVSIFENFLTEKKWKIADVVFTKVNHELSQDDGICVVIYDPLSGETERTTVIGNHDDWTVLDIVAEAIEGSTMTEDDKSYFDETLDTRRFYLPDFLTPDYSSVR